ncbi:MAG: sugar phosphate isomerase/epimerase [Bacteroidetes bacterium]|nr:sugar phosphate isomerase/epimerase [Fibrella sp.]
MNPTLEPAEIRILLSRRRWLQSSGVLAGAALVSPSWLTAGDAPSKPTYKIGACDWSLNQTAQVSAFEVARQIGLDGVQISYNSAADETYLARPESLTAIREAAHRTGVQVASIGMARLNEVPYKSDPRTEEWVSNAIDAAKALKVSTILLAFFSRNDLRNDPAGKKVVIERLKQVAPKAEQAGVNLAIESYLTAAEHLDLIQAVGSKAITVYYDFRNATDAGNDIFKEIPMLGKAMISEMHMKENGQLLGKGPLDWPRISRVLADIGYTGWMQIEGATPKGAPLVEAYQQNLTYLRTLFPA